MAMESMQRKGSIVMEGLLVRVHGHEKSSWSLKGCIEGVHGHRLGFMERVYGHRRDSRKIKEGVHGHVRGSWPRKGSMVEGFMEVHSINSSEASF